MLTAHLAFVALCLLHGYRGYVTGLNTTATLYAPAAAPPPTPLVPPLAERLYVLIIDGLRSDAVDGMPALQALAARGARRTLVAGLPSFTSPSLTTLVTGIEPFYSGIRLNIKGVHHRFDTLLSAAGRAGVPSALAVTRWQGFALALDWKNGPVAPRLLVDELPGRARRREIVWIHFDAVDDAGHSHGARSRQYRAAVARADELVGRLAAALDLSRDAFVVLSDHGHLWRGGHGGDEPEVRHGVFVAAGPGVAAGRRLPPAPMVDGCATLAMLIGVPPPADNRGAPMLDLLAPSVDRAAAVQPADGERALAAARLAVAPAEVQSQLDARRRARMRLAVPMAIALFALCRLPWWRPQPRDLLPLTVFAVVFVAAYTARGYRLGWALWSYVGFLVETAAFGLAGGAAAFLVGRWRRLGGPVRAARQASVLFAFAAAYAIAVAQSGNDPAWLEGPHRSFVLVFVATFGAFAALTGVALLLRGLRATRRA